MSEDISPLRSGSIRTVSRLSLEVLQVNLGYRCNQRYSHCHVNAGPERKETMGLSTFEELVEFLDSSAVRTLDLTGGAPELSPHFKELVRVSRGMGNPRDRSLRSYDLGGGWKRGGPL